MPAQAVGTPYSLLPHQTSFPAELKEAAKGSVRLQRHGRQPPKGLSGCMYVNLSVPAAPTPPGPECNWQLRSGPKAGDK